MFTHHFVNTAWTLFPPSISRPDKKVKKTIALYLHWQAFCVKKHSVRSKSLAIHTAGREDTLVHDAAARRSEGIHATVVAFTSFSGLHCCYRKWKKKHQRPSWGLADAMSNCSSLSLILNTPSAPLPSTRAMTSPLWRAELPIATANCATIKPLECVLTFLAGIPEWPAQFSGRVSCALGVLIICVCSWVEATGKLKNN